MPRFYRLIHRISPIHSISNFSITAPLLPAAQLFFQPLQVGIVVRRRRGRFHLLDRPVRAAQHPVHHERARQEQHRRQHVHQPVEPAARRLGQHPIAVAGHKIVADLLLGPAFHQQVADLLAPLSAGHRRADVQRRVLAHRAVQMLGDGVDLIIRWGRRLGAGRLEGDGRQGQKEQQPCKRKNRVDVGLIIRFNFISFQHFHQARLACVPGADFARCTEARAPGPARQPPACQK